MDSPNIAEVVCEGCQIFEFQNQLGIYTCPNKRIDEGSVIYAGRILGRSCNSLRDSLLHIWRGLRLDPTDVTTRDEDERQHESPEILHPSFGGKSRCQGMKK